jgi:hypothetical protein
METDVGSFHLVNDTLEGRIALAPRAAQFGRKDVPGVSVVGGRTAAVTAVFGGTQRRSATGATNVLSGHRSLSSL